MCVLELLGVVQQRRQYQHIPMTLPFTHHDENRKNLYNNDNTHNADRWDLKAWDETQNSSLSISLALSLDC